MLNILKNGQTLSLDANGNLNINLAAGSISGGNLAASLTGAVVPANADYQGINIAGTLTGITGLSLGSSRAPTVAIVDGAGNQITSFGGGTQFADNAASGATPTGTLAMGWDSVNTKVRALKVDSNQNLNVTLGSSTVDVSDRVARLLGHVVIDTGANVIGSLTANQSVNVNQIGGSGITLGQKVMASSVPVVIASDQVSILITDPAEGVPVVYQYGSSTPPSQAIQIAGADLTGKLRVLQTDNMGVAQVNDIYNQESTDRLIAEVCAMRRAIVALVTESGRHRPEDFAIENNASVWSW